MTITQNTIPFGRAHLFTSSRWVCSDLLVMHDLGVQRALSSAVGWSQDFSCAVNVWV